MVSPVASGTLQGEVLVAGILILCCLSVALGTGLAIWHMPSDGHQLESHLELLRLVPPPCHKIYQYSPELILAGNLRISIFFSCFVC